MRGLHASPYIPRKSNPEFKELVKRSTHNIIPLLLDAPTNAIAVEGYRRPDVTGNPPEWRWWQHNRLDQRQSFVHREALATGSSYVSVLPNPANPKEPQVRGYPAIRMMAAYDDPVFDAFPLYALYLEDVNYSKKNRVKGQYFDDTFVYEVEVTDKVRILSRFPHGLGVCPIIRFTPKMDLLGRTTGMVEGVIRQQDKLNQMFLSLLIAQHYTGFAVRWATGLSPVERLDENGMPILDQDGQPTYVPPVLDPSTMLISPNESTSFGQLPAAETKDFLDAIELVVRHMCAVTETPPHYLLSGKLANLSADALAAAESAFTRKVDEIRHSFGESWELVLRLCALIAGDQGGWDAVDAEVTWADKGNRSLAQAADAGVKLFNIGVPTDLILAKMPGFTQRDIDDVKQRLEEQYGSDSLAEKFAQRIGGRPSDEESNEQDNAEQGSEPMPAA